MSYPRVLDDLPWRDVVFELPYLLVDIPFCGCLVLFFVLNVAGGHVFSRVRSSKSSGKWRGAAEKNRKQRVGVRS